MGVQIRYAGVVTADAAPKDIRLIEQQRADPPVPAFIRRRPAP
jgi:hypothetical protein